MSKIIQISESALRKIVREEVAKVTEPKEPTEWVSVAEFRRRTKMSYGRYRTLRTTRPYLFTEKDGNKQQSQYKINYTAYKQTA